MTNNGKAIYLTHEQKDKVLSLLNKELDRCGSLVGQQRGLSKEEEESIPVMLRLIKKTLKAFGEWDPEEVELNDWFHAYDIS